MTSPGITPTDAERETAAQVVEASAYRGQKILAKNIAQALADQRAKYEAVADELDGWRDNADRFAAAAMERRLEMDAARAQGRRLAYERSADRIRQVSG